MGLDLFSATEQLSLTLQGVDTTIQEAVQALKLALNYLGRQRSDDSLATIKFLNRFYR